MSTDSGGSSGKRAWLAGLLGIIVPGMGHLYLKLWGRALLWFLLYVGAVLFLVPADVRPSTLSLEAILQAQRSIPFAIQLSLLSVEFFSGIDAYLLASKSGDSAAGEGGGQTCPNCGKDLDEDLDFCHWCTTELHPETEE